MTGDADETVRVQARDLAERQKGACDLIIERAVALMHATEAPAEVIIDRLLTYAGAQAALKNGSSHTAEVFRLLADNIDRGCFFAITGEGSGNSARRH